VQKIELLYGTNVPDDISEEEEYTFLIVLI
jgi:hypothetical protein